MRHGLLQFLQSVIAAKNTENDTNITTHGKITPCQTDMASIPAVVIFPEKYFCKYETYVHIECWNY